MALRRGFQGRIPARSKRIVAWGFGPDFIQGVVAGTGKTLWSTAIALTGNPRATIVRIRGSLMLRLILATSVGDGFHGAIGLGVTTNEAFTAGAASIPGPVTQADWGGWMWHSFFQVLGIAAQSSGQDTARNITADIRMDIDSKAMRKFEDEQVLFGMVESTEVGVASMSVDADTRVLFKLS